MLSVPLSQNYGGILSTQSNWKKNESFSLLFLLYEVIFLIAKAR